MEVIRDPETEKYIIRLGGVVWNNCTVDTDCPGRAVCGVNTTWSEYPSICQCTFMYDLSGAECETIGSYGWFFFIVNLISSLISTISFLIGISALVKLVRLGQFKRDALSMSLVLALLATLFTALQTAAIDRFSFQVISPDENGMRRDTLRLGTLFLAFAFSFTTASMLNVSLVWTEVADNAGKVRQDHSAAMSFNRYRKILFGYYAFFFTMFAVALALGQVYGLFVSLLIATIVAVPGTVFIIVSYVVGSFKMRRMLNTYLSAMGSLAISGSAPVNGPEVNQRMKESLRAIQYAALGVGLLAILFVTFASTWVALGGLVDHPAKQVNLIPMALLWLSISLGNFVVMWYLNGSIRRRIRAMPASGIASSSRKADIHQNVIVVVAPSDEAMRTPTGKVLPQDIQDLVVESFSRDF